MANNSLAHRIPPHKPSAYLQDETNQMIFNMLTTGSRVVQTAVVQFMKSSTNYPGGWLECFNGVVTLTKDNSRRSMFLQLFDVDKNSMEYEFAFNSKLPYYITSLSFHEFDVQDERYGLNFFYDTEAKEFEEEIRNRAKSQNKKKKVKPPLESNTASQKKNKFEEKSCSFTHTNYKSTDVSIHHSSEQTTNIHTNKSSLFQPQPFAEPPIAKFPPPPTSKKGESSINKAFEGFKLTPKKPSTLIADRVPQPLPSEILVDKTTNDLPGSDSMLLAGFFKSKANIPSPVRKLMSNKPKVDSQTKNASGKRTFPGNLPNIPYQEDYNIKMGFSKVEQIDVTVTRIMSESQETKEEEIGVYDDPSNFTSESMNFESPNSNSFHHAVPSTVNKPTFPPAPPILLEKKENFSIPQPFQSHGHAKDSVGGLSYPKPPVSGKPKSAFPSLPSMTTSMMKENDEGKLPNIFLKDKKMRKSSQDSFPSPPPADEFLLAQESSVQTSRSMVLDEIIKAKQFKLKHVRPKEPSSHQPSHSTGNTDAERLLKVLEQREPKFRQESESDFSSDDTDWDE